MKSNLPLISVIVPNYNHEKYLKERLDSIFNQTYPNFEVILLDDCSTDNSRTIISEYANDERVSYCFFNGINTGNTFLQWNKGIELAKGDFIWIAESDDFCDSNFLEEVCKPLIENEEVVLSYCQSNRVDENGIVTGNWLDQTNDLDKDLFLRDFVFDGNEFIENFLIYRNVIPNASAVIFRKKDVLELGYLDVYKSFKYTGDWLFYLKLIVNKKISFVSPSLNNFRFHSESVISLGFNAESIKSRLAINLEIRNNLNDYLLQKKPVNLSKITKLNRIICRENKCKIALFNISNNNKIFGFIQLIKVFDIFLLRYNFIRKRIIKTQGIL
jgi:glycosyltransferase involved in cell wall biosynthesis